jgi:hypothetical protein
MIPGAGVSETNHMWSDLVPGLIYAKARMRFSLDQVACLWELRFPG